MKEERGMLASASPLIFFVHLLYLENGREMVVCVRVEFLIVVLVLFIDRLLIMTNGQPVMLCC